MGTPPHIFSGAVTPSSPRPLASTARTQSASFKRAYSHENGTSGGLTPLLDQDGKAVVTLVESK